MLGADGSQRRDASTLATTARSGMGRIPEHLDGNRLSVMTHRYQYPGFMWSSNNLRTKHIETNTFTDRGTEVSGIALNCSADKLSDKARSSLGPTSS